MRLQFKQNHGQDAVQSLTNSPNEKAAPLKRQLASMDYESGAALLAPPVQGKGPIAETNTDGIQAVAQKGVQSGGSMLPHLDAIQQSFGPHDVSSVQAHVGGQAGEAASSIGAEAYATGSNIAFQKQPDLHTAAHEAAHVVQQRAGVQLSGGVGKAGDSYEQHADQVADAVVQGKSAESVLDKMGGRGGGNAVQAKAVQAKPDTKVDPKRLGGLMAQILSAAMAARAGKANPFSFPLSPRAGGDVGRAYNAELASAVDAKIAQGLATMGIAANGGTLAIMGEFHMGSAQAWCQDNIPGWDGECLTAFNASWVNAGADVPKSPEPKGDPVDGGNSGRSGWTPPENTDDGATKGGGKIDVRPTSVTSKK